MSCPQQNEYREMALYCTTIVTIFVNKAVPLFQCPYYFTHSLQYTYDVTDTSEGVHITAAVSFSTVDLTVKHFSMFF